MNFATAVKNQTCDKLTENGAAAFSELSNPTLTLFGQIGAMRNRDEADIWEKFEESYKYNRNLTLKMLFYCGNIRGGLGERRVFRIGLKWLATKHIKDMYDNLHLVSLFNRWDSLFCLYGINEFLDQSIDSLIAETLCDDEERATQHKSISLLAKWMPSEKASSEESRKLAKHFIRVFGISPRDYRKMLSYLRKYLKVVEVAMSAGNWESIDYEGVPSKAMLNYRKAFRKHDPVGYESYLNAVAASKSKINAGTLYPYDLVSKYFNAHVKDNTVEEQWKALPNYVSGENNYLVMADVSGSMFCCNGRPIATSIGLATYFAQRNHGLFSNLYMTFTDEPHFIILDKNSTLFDAVLTIRHTDIGYNTNLEAAFDYVLGFAKENEIKFNEMPKALIVVSDMEIDSYIRDYGLDFVGTMKTKFNRAGYKLPKLILWNVEARNNTFLTKNPDVIQVSGQSASTFKQLCGALDGKSAWDFMVETLNDEMYRVVKI